MLHKKKVMNGMEYKRLINKNLKAIFHAHARLMMFQFLIH